MLVSYFEIVPTRLQIAPDQFDYRNFLEILLVGRSDDDGFLGRVGSDVVDVQCIRQVSNPPFDVDPGDSLRQDGLRKGEINENDCGELCMAEMNLRIRLFDQEVIARQRLDVLAELDVPVEVDAAHVIALHAQDIALLLPRALHANARLHAVLLNHFRGVRELVVDSAPIRCDEGRFLGAADQLDPSFVRHFQQNEILIEVKLLRWRQ